jgi:alanine racemase
MTTATAGQATAEQRASAARAVLEVDLAAVRHNVEVIRRAAGGARIMAVVKGDAYGLGATVIARALETWGVPTLAVDNVAEGVSLRANGISAPVMIIDGDVPDNAPLAVKHGLMPGIAHERLLAAYEGAARRRGGKHPIWLAANVGFNRAGYRDPEKFARFAARASECRHLEVRGIYAHLTNSNSDADLTLAQIEEYGRQAERARQLLGAGLETSLFASHGLVRWARAFPTDWVRPGILLCGEHDFVGEELEPEAADLLRQFRPVVSLRARVIHLLEFSGVEGVGYGQHHHTEPGQRLATVAVGFGGGYPSPPGRAYALAGGRRAAVFGKVGMDALQIDVTDVTGLALDDWATLIGCDGAERVSVRDLARAAGTSPYELLRRLRCHRIYVNAENISL